MFSHGAKITYFLELCNFSLGNVAEVAVISSRSCRDFFRKSPRKVGKVAVIS
jgi:hypothetical protein